MEKILYIASDYNQAAEAAREALKAAGYEVHDVGSVEESRFALFNELKATRLVIYHEYAGDDFDAGRDLQILRDNNWRTGLLLVITDQTADEFFEALKVDLCEDNIDFLFANHEDIVTAVKKLMEDE